MEHLILVISMSQEMLLKNGRKIADMRAVDVLGPMGIYGTLHDFGIGLGTGYISAMIQLELSNS